MLEELIKYFEMTSQDEILKDWDKSAYFDTLGPTVEEFLKSTPLNYVISTPPILPGYQMIKNNYSPEFSSGFFNSIIYSQYAKSSVYDNQLSIR